MDARDQHDGYRLLVRREGKTVRLFIRRGFDWTDRCPAIARTADCGPGHSELTHADPGGRIDG
jgi:ATP-dependent DNA ligase